MTTLKSKDATRQPYRKDIEKYFSTIENAPGEEGIVKLISRTALKLLSFSPGLYIRIYSKRENKPIIIELYVVFKTILALMSCVFFQKSWLLISILLLATFETILYNLFFILSGNLLGNPISAKRSLILGFINYWQVVFSFGYFYRFLEVVISGSGSDGHLSFIDYIYFSIATGGILDYGDYKIVTGLGKTLAIIECITFAMFFLLFISYNLSFFTSLKSPQMTSVDEENLEQVKE